MADRKIEIVDICAELEKLARAGVLAQSTENACFQASSLLKDLRELIITSTGSPDKHGDTVARLKWILSEQGEG